MQGNTPWINIVHGIDVGWIKGLTFKMDGSSTWIHGPTKLNHRQGNITQDIQNTKAVERRAVEAGGWFGRIKHGSAEPTPVRLNHLSPPGSIPIVGYEDGGNGWFGRIPPGSAEPSTSAEAQRARHSSSLLAYKYPLLKTDHGTL